MFTRPFVPCLLLMALAVVFLASTPTLNAFTVSAQQKSCRGRAATATITATVSAASTSTSTSTSTSSESKLFSSPTGDNQEQPPPPPPSSPPKPDLVDQTLFQAAIHRIHDEIEAQFRAQKIAEGTATEEPSEDEREWLAEQAAAKDDEQKYLFLVGKLDVTLPIDTQPELDLTESIGPLVLVTNVWGDTAENTGLQEFDTITKISVDDPQRPFVVATKCTSLEETAGALTAAAQHSIALGKTEIQLEVQRLIKGYYAPDK